MQICLKIHCHAHKLNLSLQDATAQLKNVSDILLIIQNVSEFVERSAKWHALFEHIWTSKRKRRCKIFAVLDGHLDTLL